MVKKEFTSFDIAAVVQEINETIKDSRVNNIYQFNSKTLLFKLHKIDKPPIRLVMEAGRRLHLTIYAQESPTNPPAFCMALRKYLRDAWLTSIQQYEFERIVIISFKTKTGIVKLLLELFGDGNVILIDEKENILQAMVFKQMRDRNILRNELFLFPPSSSKNPFKVTITELEKTLKDFGETQIVRAIARFLGIGGFYAEEVLLRANIEKTKACSALASSEINSIFQALQSLLSAILTQNLEPSIILNQDGSYLDVAPVKLKRYDAYKTQAFDSFNQALDEFYLQVTATEKALRSVEVDKLTQETERLKRVITDQEKIMREEETSAERDKKVGDTIYANFIELETISKKILSDIREGRSWKESSEKLGDRVIVQSLDAKNQVLNLSIDDFNFSINLRRPLLENASDYYERGKKAKQKSSGALSALEDSKRKLAGIEQELREAEERKTLKPAEILEELTKRKVKSKEWFEKFRWFTSSDGFLVVAGKDTVSNEVLIKKYTNPEDVVFHAEISGAPFVVVKSEGKPVSDQTLHEAGEFAASFSRAWRENAGSVDVYWVKPEQLSKSGPSGESVPHGAFAVVGKRNWMRSVPLKLAVGVEVNEETCFVGGPIDAVVAKTKEYVVIVPGDLNGKELLKQILKSITIKLPKDQREKVGKTSIEQIREFVPYTKATIIEKG